MAKAKQNTEPTAEEQGTQYVNIKFPPGFTHPYQMTDSNDKTWDKAIVNIPPGTNMNGIDLTGYSTDVFLRPWQKSQIANGEPVVYGFKEDEKIELFKGEGDERESLAVDPWKLTGAIKEQREDYAAQKAAERAAQEQAEKQPSLADRQEATKNQISQDAAGGKDEPAKAAPDNPSL